MRNFVDSIDIEWTFSVKEVEGETANMNRLVVSDRFLVKLYLRN